MSMRARHQEPSTAKCWAANAIMFARGVTDKRRSEGKDKDQIITPYVYVGPQAHRQQTPIYATEPSRL